jgi:2-dehydro-3-deoxy-D-arabinonate dehydratase
MDAAIGAGMPVAGRLLAPVDGDTEVWAAGVTYQRSMDARISESSVADVYDRVYAAPRPELFFKSVAWRVVGHGGQVGIRADSGFDVPEPELALVLNSRAEIVGATICNDMSSRSIEGDNPLYLPQAKIYSAACAIGPGIRPAWEITDLHDLGINMSISRDGLDVWTASINTSHIRRTFAELIEHLFRAQSFPAGAVLSTGTGLVPDMDFTLHQGDVIQIGIEQVGVLINTVARCAASPHLATGEN